MDDSLMYALNGLAGRWPWLDAFMVVCALFLRIVFLIAPLIFYLIGNERVRRGSVLAVVAAICAEMVKLILAHFYFRPRPFDVLPHIHLLLVPLGDTSFPSGHVLVGSAIAVTVISFNRRFGIALLGVCVLMAIARIFIGEHYPSDVMTAMVIGTLSSLIVMRTSEHRRLRPLLDKLMSILNAICASERAIHWPRRKKPGDGGFCSQTVGI